METNITWEFSEEKRCAQGTFAIVYQSTIQESGVVVAVKKLKQNKKYKNRYRFHDGLIKKNIDF